MSDPVRPSPFDTPHRVSAQLPPSKDKSAEGKRVNLSTRPLVGPIINRAKWRHMSALRRDLRTIKICAVGLLVIAALTGGVAAGALLAPTAIAIILALVLAPAASALERLYIRPGLAALIMVAAVFSVVIVGTAAFAPSVSTWAKRAPALIQSVEHKLRPIKKQIAAMESASRQITGVSGNSRAAPAPESVSADGVVYAIASTAPGVLASILYVAVLTIFLLAYRTRYTEQLILLPRTFAGRVRMARICRDVRHRVSGYLFTLAAINVGLAVATAICFTIAGIPEPLLWGVAYGILNFIPIIGPTAIIVTAAAVGFVTSNTIAAAILPPAILLGLDVVEAYFVTPWLLSRRLVISPIAIFVMVATLVWMWGPPAAVTAVPILILIHTVMMHVPASRAFARLLATESGPRRAHPHRF
jgi:predicted PurR-regulated permease PerM